MIDLIKISAEGRMPELLPVRRGRMLQSPFAFYRGTALNMAADLSRTPTTGLRVQACGDAHLCNFGGFATAERRVIFDINDLDETLPAPWEWDVKRLAASFVLAGRDNGYRADQSRDAALACACAYRECMAEFSEMRVLDVWYSSIDVEKLVKSTQADATRKVVKKALSKAAGRTVIEHDFPALVTLEGGEPRIKDNPPLIFHWRDQARAELMGHVTTAFAGYRESLSPSLRLVLDRFRVVDHAMKVVGVGSVGTFCAVVLLLAEDDDPLFLQVKQARPSVLEPYAGKSAYANDGQRIVEGARIMQSAGDMFLGWTVGQAGRQFYVRQLRDLKIKAPVETLSPNGMIVYARLCARALARSHAVSGEPAMISGYLGSSSVFDEAIADFSIAYADQAERDHATASKAVRALKLPVAKVI